MMVAFSLTRIRIRFWGCTGYPGREVRPVLHSLIGRLPDMAAGNVTRQKKQVHLVAFSCPQS